MAYPHLTYEARWLLRYGTDVKVVAPDALREQDRAVAEMYSPAAT